MDTISPTDHGAAEIARITTEYARRARTIPRDFYGWQTDANRYHHTQVYRATIAALVREQLYPLDDLRVADIGCGNGTWLLEFAQWGARPRNLAGIDLDRSRIDRAREVLPASDLRVGDARTTGWASSSFDIVSQFTVFTSILDPGVKREVAAELIRILRPSGIVVWFDSRRSNPKNPHHRGIGFDEIRHLFPGCTVRVHSVLLAPPIARHLAGISWMAALALEKVPFLRTHCLAIIRKR
jgi:SAM-dependent methyltransferase